MTANVLEADRVFAEAVTLSNQGRLNLAIEKYRNAIALDETFAEAYCNLGISLMEAGSDEEAIANCTRAIQINPAIAEVHVTLGVLLRRSGKLADAIEHFQKGVNLAPMLISAQQNLFFTLLKVVSKWHVPMMNENERNEAYYSAIKRAANPGTHVLEIGTGSGLLALMAAKSGAASVTTCEKNEVLARTARQIISDNGYKDKISVIHKKSTELAVGQDMDQPADVMVSEVFASDLLGEGVIPTVEDAKRRLLKPGAQIIPAVGSVMIALAASEAVIRNLIVEDSFGFDLQHFNTIVPRRAAILRHDLNIEFLSDEIEALRFDFQNDSTFPAGKRTVSITANRDGECFGVIQWIKLDMGSGVFYDNCPLEPSLVANWQPTAFLFKKPIDIKKGQRVTVEVIHNRETVWVLPTDGGDKN
ncbi:MAG: tetratricopeptide repeat protein [Rhodospirillaceae bacterium]